MVKKKDDTRVRSWILLIAGLAGIGYEQYTGKVNWFLLLIFSLMAGVPGVANIISLIKNSPIVIQSSSPPLESSESDWDNSQDSSGDINAKR